MSDEVVVAAAGDSSAMVDVASPLELEVEVLAAASRKESPPPPSSTSLVVGAAAVVDMAIAEVYES